MIALSRPAWGFVWITLSCLVSSAFDVYLGHVVQGLDPIAVCVATLSSVAVVFLVTELLRGARTFLRKAREAWKDLLGFNVSGLISTSASIVAYRNLEPSAAKAIVVSVGPMLTLVLGPRLLEGFGVTRGRKLGAWVTVLATVVLVFGVFVGGSGVGRLSPKTAFVGLGAAGLSGLGVVFNTIYMDRFNKRGWTISETLAGRFVLTAALGWLLWPVSGAQGTPVLSDLPTLILVAGGWVVLPIFLFQYGLALSGAFEAGILLAAAPILTFLLQPFDPRLIFSPLIGMALVLNFLALASLAERRR